VAGAPKVERAEKSSISDAAHIMQAFILLVTAKAGSKSFEIFVQFLALPEIAILRRFRRMRGSGAKIAMFHRGAKRTPFSLKRGNRRR
jgi:hypothetical protein